MDELLPNELGLGVVAASSLSSLCAVDFLAVANTSYFSLVWRHLASSFSSFPLLTPWMLKYFRKLESMFVNAVHSWSPEYCFVLLAVKVNQAALRVEPSNLREQLGSFEGADSVW